MGVYSGRLRQTELSPSVRRAIKSDQEVPSHGYLLRIQGQKIIAVWTKEPL